MSPKLTAKSLSYDASLPPFLQRLRAQNTGSPAAAPRPMRPPNPNDADEDEPVYVDAEGTTLDSVGLRNLGVTKGGPGEGEQAVEEVKTEDGTELKVKAEEKTIATRAAIGSARKRKVGKVVGASEEEEGKGSGVTEVAPGEDKQAPPQKKKKVNKVMLSFGDDE